LDMCSVCSVCCVVVSGVWGWRFRWVVWVVGYGSVETCGVSCGCGCV
jgi:hypothetical protein